VAFLIARYFARDSVRNWLEGKEKFRQLDRLTREHGAMVVAITRLIPLFPYTLLNYGFGLTAVRLVTYAFFSWLCMLPATVAFVLVGAAGAEAAEERQVPWLLVAGLSAAILVLIVIGRYGRAYFRRHMQPTAEEAAAEGEPGGAPGAEQTQQEEEPQ
jgi:uncharacterized membrane protein YdjX (TVP38/TMEM64 family)